MMRQGMGLYGGNRVDDGKWVEGYLFRNIGGKTFIINVTENVCAIPDEVDPETVGEYSGDNPAAEEKIFENDVVKIVDDAGDEFIGVVERSECAFWVNNGKAMRKLWSTCYKVIKLGNIHRNAGCKMEGKNKETNGMSVLSIVGKDEFLKSGVCPNCKVYLESAYNPKHCGHCGLKINWRN